MVGIYFFSVVICCFEGKDFRDKVVEDLFMDQTQGCECYIALHLLENQLLDNSLRILL